MEAEERKKREAEFFDKQAAHRMGDDAPINPLVVERYRAARMDALYSLEYAIARVMPVEGKRILAAGCGEGDDAVLFAKLGAEVVGVDISPGAIEVGKQLAANSGVADRISWAVAPLEDLDIGELGRFDVVWCHAILHHLIDTFEAVVKGLWECVSPGGLAIAIEPYSLAPLLRWIRLNMLPANPNVTPDERPLEPREIELLHRYWGTGDRRNFSGLARLNRLVFRTTSFETASDARKAAANAVARIDNGILATGLGARLGSMFVMASERPADAKADPAGG